MTESARSDWLPPAFLADGDRPVFAEPWEAQLFALVVELHQQGCFSWTEWVARLSVEIEKRRQNQEADWGDTYYELWLKTIKQLLIEKSVTSKSEIEGRVDEWRRAYLNTPHGMPISLAAAHSPLNHSLSTEDL